MSWLHTWTGLVAGWVLFFMFVTGTFGYVRVEVDRWMRPELPLTPSDTPMPRSDELLTRAQARLKVAAPEALSWWIELPGGPRRGSWMSDYRIGWQVQGTEGDVSEHEETLDPMTGQPGKLAPRETAGGRGLYAMHYALHYLDEELASYIVGVCTMIMLVALLTGIVVHKKIFKDFFTFRPAKGQRSWLDGHNLLSVTSLPFQLMITWSGLIFFQFTYMPAGIDGLYAGKDHSEREDAFAAELEGHRHEHQERGDHAPAPLRTHTPLRPLLAIAQERWGPKSVQWVELEVEHGAARFQVYRYASSPVVSEDRLTFDAVTGVLQNEGRESSASEHFQRAILRLHEGLFAPPFLRLLYVLSGLAGAAMIGTGLVLWTTKRRAKLRRSEQPGFGFTLVDVLNAATMLGLPAGIAALFWANRLLPLELEARADWEFNVLFAVWGLCFPYAALRTPSRAWVELCAIAALLSGLLPVLNAFTTDRHLGVTMPEGDWVLAIFDLSAIATGAFFAWLGYRIRRRQRASGARLRVAATAAEAL